MQFTRNFDYYDAVYDCNRELIEASKYSYSLCLHAAVFVQATAHTC